MAITKPYSKPKLSTDVPHVITERFGPSVPPESSATTAAASTTTTNITIPTNATTADKPASRGTNSKYIPAADTINTGNVSRERCRARCTTYAIPGTNERVDSVTTDAGSTGACLARRSVGAARLDCSDKEHGSGLEPTIRWYRPWNDGSGYATKRVRTLCEGIFAQLTNVLYTATCIQRS